MCGRYVQERVRTHPRKSFLYYDVLFSSPAVVILHSTIALACPMPCSCQIVSFFWSVFYSMNGTVGRNEQSIVWHYLVVLRIGHKLCLWKCRGMLQLLEWGRKLGRVLVRVLSQLWPTQLGCRDGLKFILTSAMLKSTYFSLSECFHIFFFFHVSRFASNNFFCRETAGDCDNFLSNFTFFGVLHAVKNQLVPTQILILKVLACEILEHLRCVY